MAVPGTKANEISLGDDFGDVTVKANGTAVEIHADGTIDYYPILRSNRRQQSANDGGKLSAPAEPKIGARMPDGTVYAGISPDTAKPMYAMPADAPQVKNINQAKDYAQTQNTKTAYGHTDWHVPKKGELNVLFNNRAAIGGFNECGADPSGWYCSSSPSYGRCGWSQRFSTGYQDDFYPDHRTSVRLVR